MRIDFPDAGRRSKIWHIALPIMGGMISQNILNLVDIAMVGTLGDVALAATGMGSFAAFMAVAVVLGLSTGVQAMAARRLGEGRTSETAISLDGGLLLAVAVGLPTAALVIWLSPELFALLTSDTGVATEGAPYLQIRAVAIIGVGMNFSFRGYWSAVQMTRFYMRTIIVMHVSNIFLNWVLIFGNLGAPELGVSGAGLATTISIYLGTAIYFFIAIKTSRKAGFLHGIPSAETMMTMLRLSIPASLQQLFFATGMVMLFWIVGKIGTSELAATNVLMTLTLVALLPALGMGLAAGSLVGEALGKSDLADARRWGWNVALMAAVVAMVIGFGAVLLHRPVLGLFLHEADTLDLASPLLVITGVFVWFDAMGMVLMNAHLGAGDSRRMMLITVVTQWFLFLPAAYMVGPWAGFGLLGVWVVQAAYRLLQATLFMIFWQRGRWAEIKV